MVDAPIRIVTRPATAGLMGPTRMSGASSRPSGSCQATGVYRRRHPKRAVLYGVVQHHLESWLHHHREAYPAEDSIPAYVERDFRRYLDCDVVEVERQTRQRVLRLSSSPGEAPGRSPAGYLWAALLARIYDCLPLTCAHCGAPMTLTALTYRDVLMPREAGKDCSYNPFAFPPSMAVRCPSRVRVRPNTQLVTRRLLCIYQPSASGQQRGSGRCSLRSYTRRRKVGDWQYQTRCPCSLVGPKGIQRRKWSFEKGSR